jgi:hypothetical protein
MCPAQHPELMSPNRKWAGDEGRKASLFANLASSHFVLSDINTSPLVSGRTEKKNLKNAP